MKCSVSVVLTTLLCACAAQEFQSIECQDSQYGCCPDNVTSASGVLYEGCSCSTREYGCCSDDQTAALGPNFQGCPDVPEKKQAVCGLKAERGSGHNFGIQWFFDPAFGGCSRFWYGGFDGNGNRFATKEECEDICVNLPPKESCELPLSKGPCLESHFRWYYDAQNATCYSFVYGGCLGNKNNFETRELCQMQCVHENTTGVECQNSQYGCCPDNVTSASGVLYEGCSCSTSEYGCCPDDHTAATGPYLEGCSDKHENRQGIECQNSQYGCCPDNVTSASGVLYEGCSCSTSEYGCCPDDHTAATGPYLEGCSDKPENRQEDPPSGSDEESRRVPPPPRDELVASAVSSAVAPLQTTILELKQTIENHSRILQDLSRTILDLTRTSPPATLNYGYPQYIYPYDRQY